MKYCKARSYQLSLLTFQAEVCLTCTYTLVIYVEKIHGRGTVKIHDTIL